MDAPAPANPDLPRLIEQAHALYCELTAQNILLRFNWQRSWWELLRWGFTLDDVRCVVLYLQKEIRRDRRNIGALKLSNLLQPDRFEEDLNISRARLQAPRPPRPKPPKTPPPPPSPEPINRQEAAALFKQFRKQLRPHPADPHSR